MEEEEEAPVTAATGALGPVVAKLRALLRRRHGEYQLRCWTRKDIKRIRSKLKSIHSLLWVIWEREDLDAAGKELRMEAWRLADDMNDAIDDFILSLKRSNGGRRFIQEKIQSRPFKDLKRRADDVWERCRKKWKKMETAHTTFCSLFSRTKSTIDSGPGKRHRVVDPYVPKDISELVDMKDPRDKLIKDLVGEEESTPQAELKMASIVGRAGMGKTTLARLVYEAIEAKFQARAFVSITSYRNMKEVLTSILQQVAAQSIPAPHAATTPAATEKQLVHNISNFLKDKRYLVIIDDVCHSREWEIVKDSLPENYLGSRIVTTSRVNSITDKWRDDFDALVHQIYYLQSGSAGFTTKHIDKNAHMLGEGFEYDHPIVEMCRDTPLAVACMFSALAKEQERQEQLEGLCVLNTPGLQDRVEELVLRNGIQNTPGFEQLVESLELGYNDLPHHMLKTCLLYCSIYPEGDRFERNDLVRQWITQGFVRKEEVAKDYFDELVSRRLFEFQSEGVKLHPMMRNYLRWKLREDDFITCTSDGVPSSPVGLLCVDDWPASSDAMDTLSGIDDWHHIRSLVVFKDAARVPYKHLENLRVLDVQRRSMGRKALQNQHIKDMCGLLRLRHLLVSHGAGITEIPTEIARLQYLETLEVTFTKITRLPAEIGDLKQLKVLDVNWSKELTELPREMGNLQHILEILCIGHTKIREQAWEIIRTLKKLKTLDVSSNPELAGITRDIGELHQLKNLDVSGNIWITELPKEICKLQHLETLDLQGTKITQLPREIGNLQRLQILDLSEISTLTKLPQDIGKLQHLEYLNLSYTNVKKIPREIGGLKKLKNLHADVGILPFEAGQLSKLVELPECVRQAWKNYDLLSSLAGEILSFSHTWHHGDGELVVGTKRMHIPPWIKERFNNIGTLDIRICKLEEPDLDILRDMPHLTKLVLRFEAVPRKPIVISNGGFANLVYLTVDSRVPRITFKEGAMPSLWWLVFKFQFYGAQPNTEPPMGIKHLVRLVYVSFRCNEWYPRDSPCINVVIKEAWEHPNKSLQCDLLVGGKQMPFQRPDIAETSQGSNKACSSGAERDRGDPSLIYYHLA